MILALLSLWLSFGSLALAEQLNLLNETSSQDEIVLSQLASALKHDSPTFEGQLISVVTGIVTVPPSSDGLSVAFLFTWTPAHDLPALRPHQRVSVYRI